MFRVFVVLDYIFFAHFLFFVFFPLFLRLLEAWASLAGKKLSGVMSCGGGGRVVKKRRLNGSELFTIFQMERGCGWSVMKSVKEYLWVGVIRLLSVRGRENDAKMVQENCSKGRMNDLGVVK